jgi:hypothetical protein
LTAFSQTSLDSNRVKCFTYEQLKEITKAIKKGVICDSIAQNQELQILHFKDVLKVNDNIILENNNRLTEVIKQRDKTKSKLKTSIQITKFGIPLSLGAGFFIGFMLAK